MKKTNQDSQMAIKDFAGIKGLWLFGVMDGHGINGHLVSDFVKKNLPRILGDLLNGGNGHDALNQRNSLLSGKKQIVKKQSVPPNNKNNNTSNTSHFLPPLINQSNPTGGKRLSNNNFTHDSSHNDSNPYSLSIIRNLHSDTSSNKR